MVIAVQVQGDLASEELDEPASEPATDEDVERLAQGFGQRFGVSGLAGGDPIGQGGERWGLIGTPTGAGHLLLVVGYEFVWSHACAPWVGGRMPELETNVPHLLGIRGQEIPNVDRGRHRRSWRWCGKARRLRRPGIHERPVWGSRAGPHRGFAGSPAVGEPAVGRRHRVGRGRERCRAIPAGGGRDGRVTRIQAAASRGAPGSCPRREPRERRCRMKWAPRVDVAAVARDDAGPAPGSTGHLPAGAATR